MPETAGGVSYIKSLHYGKSGGVCSYACGLNVRIPYQPSTPALAILQLKPPSLTVPEG